MFNVLKLIKNKKIKKLIRDPYLYFYDFLGKKLAKRGISHIKRAPVLEIKLSHKLLIEIVNSSNNYLKAKNQIYAIEPNTRIHMLYQRHIEQYEIFFKSIRYISINNIFYKERFTKKSLYVLHGYNIEPLTIFILNIINNRNYVCFGEDGFIHSVGRPVDFSIEKKYRIGRSLTLDFIGAHFDCSHPSWLENRLNSDYKYSSQELNRAQTCINFLLNNYLSKYNNQPIYIPEYGREGKEKVLVIDQAVNDFSISLGGCNEKTFIKMLEDALIENPESDILIKVHPDMVANPNRGGVVNKKLGHYSDIDFSKYDKKRIFIIADYINPLCLLQQVDKVYVATSQMGFEALMCGKKVYIYGIPFYAGWGIGENRSTLEYLDRRKQRRSLLEIFYAAYIEYSCYINPDLGHRCEIEECMEYLRRDRDEFFIKNGIRHDLIDIKMNKENKSDLVINIAFCFDKNYYRQAIVAMLSLLTSNKDNHVKYAIYCVIEKDITEEDCIEIRKYLLGNHSLKQIEFKYNDCYFENAYECRGISKAAYTRLSLHRIFPELDKIIYSDIDVIFNKTLRELYEIELGSYLMGACIDPLMNDDNRWNLRLKKYSYWSHFLYATKGQYFSSGLLLINLNNMRSGFFDKELLKLKDQNFEYQDMDIINIIANDYIYPLSNKYCVLTNLLKQGGYKRVKDLHIVPDSYISEVYNDPVIFHFAGKKPWDDVNIPGADIWWNQIELFADLKASFIQRLNILKLVDSK